MNQALKDEDYNVHSLSFKRLSNDRSLSVPELSAAKIENRQFNLPGDCSGRPESLWWGKIIAINTTIMYSTYKKLASCGSKAGSNGPGLLINSDENKPLTRRINSHYILCSWIFVHHFIKPIDYYYTRLYSKYNHLSPITVKKIYGA